MDLSEKDAARSKWKLTQKHRRGRGRGPSGAGRGGRGGTRTGGAARDLGSNEDRYRDVEAEAAAAAEALGPVQRSQGRDLAELLSQAEPFDRGFYYRTRVNLAEEVGLPPDIEAGGYQGLSFDLKGLGTCLELIPKNQLLDTDAFSEDSWRDGSWGEPGQLPDLEDEWGAEQSTVQPPVQQQTPASSTPAAGTAPQAAGAPRPPAAAPTAAPQAAAGHTAAVPMAVAAKGGAAVSAGEAAGDDVDDLLSELLGEKAAIGSTAGGSTAAQREQPQQAAAAAAPASRPMKAQQPAAGLPSAQQQQQHRRQQSNRDEDHDAELDALLGIATGQPSVTAGSSKTVQGGRSTSRQQAPKQQEQSLEDWLDAL